LMAGEQHRNLTAEKIDELLKQVQQGRPENK
jgi:hypothetical protein